MIPGRPVRHQIGIGNQDPRRIGMGFKNPDRFAGLHQQGFINLKVFKGSNNLIVALPVPRRPANAAVDHQLFRGLGHLRIKVIHQHPHRGF